MSRSGKVTLAWGDGDYVFRLGIAQLEELDELCDVGPGHALAALQAGVYGPWRARWLREVHRLGLIGGGMSAAAALHLVKRYVEERPLSENIATAVLVLQAAVVGVEDDNPGEAKGEGEPSTTAPPSPTAESASPTSTAPALQPASRPPRSANAASGNSKPTSPAGAKRTVPTKAKG